jgi:hypothetical protein
MVIEIILMTIAGFFKAMMDTLQFHFYDSVFNVGCSKFGSFFNPEVSWRNKYVDGMTHKGRVKWLWGFINKPVAFTDMWHLSQSIYLNAIFIIMLFLYVSSPNINECFFIGEIIGLIAVFKGVFVLSYNIILIKKENWKKIF